VMDLKSYDLIIVNTSAGKDSLAMLDYVHTLATAEGVADRLVAVHADLGRVEWQGTRELAETQAEFFGVRFEAVARPQGDLLEHVKERGKWPSSTTRYCTSDHKRGQVGKVITALANERYRYKPVRVLNCMGFRAQESDARAKREVLSRDTRQTGAGTKKVVDTWLPILAWTEADVWTAIKASGAPYHPAYDLGMPRLSCVFCIFAPKAALVLAGKHNPELLAEYVQVEQEIGHRFTVKLSMAEVAQAVASGENTGEMTSWTM
jgi:3'-phosphoadenosine 5'-phosphosulfate sulfotransferase (PAPS reductase)/FAD synthetase